MSGLKDRERLLSLLTRIIERQQEGIAITKEEEEAQEAEAIALGLEASETQTLRRPLQSFLMDAEVGIEVSQMEAEQEAEDATAGAAVMESSAYLVHVRAHLSANPASSDQKHLPSDLVDVIKLRGHVGIEAKLDLDRTRLIYVKNRLLGATLALSIQHRHASYPHLALRASRRTKELWQRETNVLAQLRGRERQKLMEMLGRISSFQEGRNDDFAGLPPARQPEAVQENEDWIFAVMLTPARYRRAEAAVQIMQLHGAAVSSLHKNVETIHSTVVREDKSESEWLTHLELIALASAHSWRELLAPAAPTIKPTSSSSPQEETESSEEEEEEQEATQQKEAERKEETLHPTSAGVRVEWTTGTLNKDGIAMNPYVTRLIQTAEHYIGLKIVWENASLAVPLPHDAGLLLAYKEAGGIDPLYNLELRIYTDKHVYMRRGKRDWNHAYTMDHTAFSEFENILAKVPFGYQFVAAVSPGSADYSTHVLTLPNHAWPDLPEEPVGGFPAAAAASPLLVLSADTLTIVQAGDDRSLGEKGRSLWGQLKGLVKPDSFEYVDRVVDGDTVVLRNGEKIRLWGIDAPEYDARVIDTSDKNQAYGKEAKAELERILLEHGAGRVYIRRRDKDIFQRTLATLYDPANQTTDLNVLMIVHGAAWFYRQVRGTGLSLKRAYQEAEDTAKAEQVGLWGASEEAPLEPAEFRRQWRTKHRRRGILRRRSAGAMPPQPVASSSASPPQPAEEKQQRVYVAASLDSRPLVGQVAPRLASASSAPASSMQETPSASAIGPMTPFEGRPTYHQLGQLPHGWAWQGGLY